MARTESLQRVDLACIVRHRGKKSKKWRLYQTLLQLLLLTLTVVSVSEVILAELAVIAALALPIPMYFMGWRADLFKDQMHRLLLKFELWKGLEWDLPEHELRDLVLAVQESYSDDSDSCNVKAVDYFTSSEREGCIRLLKNLYESAWWTKHLASYTARRLSALTAVALLTSFFVLGMSVHAAVHDASYLNVAKVVASTIVTLVSCGYVRSAVEYLQLSTEASSIVKSSVLLFEIPKDAELKDALSLLLGYHAVRCNSPLIPEVVYKWNRPRLNDAWKSEGIFA